MSEDKHCQGCYEKGFTMGEDSIKSKVAAVLDKWEEGTGRPRKKGRGNLTGFPSYGPYIVQSIREELGLE